MTYVPGPVILSNTAQVIEMLRKKVPKDPSINVLTTCSHMMEVYNQFTNDFFIINIDKDIENSTYNIMTRLNELLQKDNGWYDMKPYFYRMLKELSEFRNLNGITGFNNQYMYL